MGYYKFFQIFKFFFYGLTSRRNKKLLKILLVCIAIFIGIFWLSQNCAFASTMTNENITDSIQFKYDSICIDFLRRYEKLNNNDKETLKNRFLNENTMDYYIYYNNVNGSDMLDSGTYLDNNLNIVFYNTYSSNMQITYSSYTYYMGLQCNHILDCTSTQYGFSRVYTLNRSGILTLSSNLQPQVFIPSELLNYNSWVIYDYFYNQSSLAQIEQKLEDIQNTQQEMYDFLTDDTIDTSETNPIDVSIFDEQEDKEQQIDDTLTGIIAKWQDIIPSQSANVRTIEIPLPHTSQKLILYSNAISKYVNYFNNYNLYILIETAWYAMFFIYFFMLFKRVLDWVCTGQMLESGMFGFIKYLEKENAVINASMM